MFTLAYQKLTISKTGHTKGITVPNPEAQLDLIRSTYLAAELSFADTGYLEAHVSLCFRPCAARTTGLTQEAGNGDRSGRPSRTCRGCAGDSGIEAFGTTLRRLYQVQCELGIRHLVRAKETLLIENADRTH